MLLRPLPSLLCVVVVSLSRFVLGDIEFTKPAGGASVTGGSTLSIEWKDSGDAPSIADLQSYTLFLCAGGNENPVCSGLGRCDEESWGVRGRGCYGEVGQKEHGLIQSAGCRFN